ncbi:MAG: DNA-binding protein WhiA [Clostridia bacterium]|nr:DNA-binding protein WhiA [Clostridia bacterium]
MEPSFSQKVKTTLAEAEIKKKCCRHTADDCAALGDEDHAAAALEEVFRRCRCEGCRGVLLRTLFLRWGSVSDPAKSYQLDLAFHDGEFARTAAQILAECGFFFGEAHRRGRPVLTLRAAETIGDFLAFIGATGEAFDFMNVKIEREFRGNVNRQVNFDTANIAKQLAAAEKVAHAAAKLRASGRYDRLPAEVRAAAEAREANPQLTLEDLGKLSDPPVSKSGMRHRLERLLEAARCDDGPGGQTE